ncbi:MAG: hypothetical protein COS14_10690 [Bacteroidetes bacterium CG02_land_8_20_14_3_00_31_25]|nr:hypothetical protein [Bacteroidota bacterium]PIV58233.1 MAG: hypothetical protein COS14_10690 [Bacteroidetes bacterium CG02_land_8_20_14_3_00_31_25]PIX36294.1 MAG: hypothetical protein COZ59_01855 [Bacteroidetes bacterium CG_4_8_14_3_um_filter_31_14]PIY05211.1 MAG: hypothetical protein COZ21_04555 [Bacteroidetes bacterium CG_4_10_14_3_um_filter_31_20]
MNIDFLDIFKQSFLVSGFVLFMMLIIEYINVRTKEKWSSPLKKSKWVQLIIAIFLGVTPGCAGIFAVVSLYTHNIINFSALLSGTIATVGDESFIMLSLIPLTAIKIFVYVAIIAFVAGIVFNFIIKKQINPKFEKHLQLHGDDCCAKGPFEHHTHKHEKKYGFTFARSMFVAILILIIFSQFVEFGNLHEAGHEHSVFSSETIIFFGMGLISLFVIITVPEHFLMEHLWGHVLKKHFARLIMWTLGALIFIAFLNQYLPFDEWTKANSFWILLLAIGVGILPTSGPHIIFITLFMQGAIPFSFLLANSIVQEGHGGIPLLAEDKWSFVKIKLIKITIALIIGLLGMYFTF